MDALVGSRSDAGSRASLARLAQAKFTGEVENSDLWLGMSGLKKALSGHPRIEHVLGRANVESVTDLAEKLRIHVTPETDVRALLDQMLSDERTANFVLDTSIADEAERLVRRNGDGYDGLLVRFFIRGDTAAVVRDAAAGVRSALSELSIDRLPGVDVQIGGGEITLGLESVHYRDAMLWSVCASLVGNFLVLWLAWRRAKPALLAMLPLVLAAALVVGVMPVFGVTLNPINLTVGAIVIGLGIDYPIHIIERFEEERSANGLGRREAARAAIATMGPHILAGMLTTAVGFGASCVLLLPLAESFGLLTATAVVFVYLGSVFALPVLLVWRPSASTMPETKS